MASPAADRGNDWRSQPRDRNTGRWLKRHPEESRTETIKIRLTPSERAQIERAADQAGQSMTSWLLAAAAAYSQPEEPMGASALLEHLFRRRR